MDISDNILTIRKKVPDHVKIVAVSKTMSPETVMEAYRAGLRIFGENRVQELTAKYPLLPDDIQWHFIGHLQTNKVRFVIPFVSMIHSVDSEKLLRQIDREGRNLGKKTECLLQVKIASENSKFGMDPDNTIRLINAYKQKQFKYVSIKGLMGMATLTNDVLQIRHEFEFLAGFYRELKKSMCENDKDFCELSMGMSGDYQIAIEAGSTMVRLGSLIFGERNN